MIDSLQMHQQLIKWFVFKLKEKNEKKNSEANARAYATCAHTSVHKTEETPNSVSTVFQLEM